MCRSGVWLRMAACSCRSTAGTAGLRCRRLVRVPGKDYGEGGRVDWWTGGLIRMRSSSQAGGFGRPWKGLGAVKGTRYANAGARCHSREAAHTDFVSSPMHINMSSHCPTATTGRGGGQRVAWQTASSRQHELSPESQTATRWPCGTRGGPRSMDASANEQAQDEVKRLSWLIWASRQSGP